MSGILKPCPWCGGQNIDWLIQAFSRRGHMVCEDCDARGPSFSIPSGPRDANAISAAALEAWNGYSA